MTSQGPEFYRQLILEGESSRLDFKRDQYGFANASEDAKSELLKDILAFANAWRSSTAYILIGVEEKKGGGGSVVGITNHLEDAALQQFVNKKTQRPLEFSYRTVDLEGKKIGIIEIPTQVRPLYIEKDYGKVKRDKVYLRRGSSTDIASLDEVRKMGVEDPSMGSPDLKLEWADADGRRGLTSSASFGCLILRPVLAVDELPEFGKYRSPHSLFLNGAYPRELIEYSFEQAFLAPVGFRLSNLSGRVGKRIRFVGEVERARGLKVVDWESMSGLPNSNLPGSAEPRIVSLADRLDKASIPSVHEYKDGWEITIEFGDIRPQEEIWSARPVYIGSEMSRKVVLAGKLRGDNLPEPIEVKLDLDVKSESRPMEPEDVRAHMRASRE